MLKYNLVENLSSPRFAIAVCRRQKNRYAIHSLHRVRPLTEKREQCRKLK